MKELLARFKQEDQQISEHVGTVQGQSTGGRTAQLRAKYALQLAELSKKAFRSGASEDDISNFEASLNGVCLPKELGILYRAADGECSQGLLLPNIRFLRLAHARLAMDALRYGAQANALPGFVAMLVPFIEDAIGNYFCALSELSSDNDQSIYLLNVEDHVLFKVSNNVEKLFIRLAMMNEENSRARSIVCPGDFRSLTRKEKEITDMIECDVYPKVDTVGVTVFPLDERESWKQSWR